MEADLSTNVPPPLAVLDTNVVLDWLVFRDARVAAVAAAVSAGRLRWAATARMREELAHVVQRDALARWQPDVHLVLDTFDRHAEMRPTPRPCKLLSRDPDDQVFIDLAVGERAAWLFTLDRALLALARRARPLGVRVTRPAGWPAEAAAPVPPWPTSSAREAGTHKEVP